MNHVRYLSFQGIVSPRSYPIEDILMDNKRPVMPDPNSVFSKVGFITVSTGAALILIRILWVAYMTAPTNF